MFGTVHRALRAAPGRAALVALAGAGAAVALLTPTVGATVPAHAAAAASCRSSQLVNWLDTDSNGTAGTIFYELQFTNLGSTCTLRGYPGVQAVALGGGRLGAPGRRITGIGVSTVTLSRGQTVRAALGIVDTGALPNCSPTTAVGLRVIAPNTTASTLIPFPFSSCSRANAGALTIRPVVR